MSRKPQLSFAIDGLDGLMKSLAQFKSKTTAKRITRASINKAATTLLKGARANAPTDTETLKKALVKKVAAKGAAVTAIIGADAGVSKTVAAGRRRTPANYLYLVEFGHVDRGGNPVPGSHFLERTGRELGPNVAQKFADEVAARILKELAKNKAKGKK